MTAVAVLLASLIPLEAVLALDPPTTIDSPQLFTGDSFAPRPSQTAGAHIERVAFNIPPGRNNLTPDLALVYNSQDLTDNVAGYGWSLSIPYVERQNKTGSENLYVDNYFSSSLGGELATTTTENEYRHRLEDGRFITYTFSNNAWVAFDKNGTRYLFGTTTQAQQSATTSPDNVYRWMLEEVRDTNDNFMTFEYTTDDNQIYPSKITYTGHGSTDGVFEIDFTYEDRPDPVTSYRSAFKVVTRKRLDEVRASVNDFWVRKYTLVYTSGVNGARSLLSSVQETGRDDQSSELTLPATTFGYSSSTPSYEDHTNPRVLSNTRVVADVDGNGLPDISIFYEGTLSNKHRHIDENEYPNFNSSDTQVTTEFWTYDNSGGTGANRYPPLERGTRFFDMNGDGRADIFRTFKDGSTYTQEYYESTSPFTWTQKTATGTMPTFACVDSSSTFSTGLFGNINGDGLTDYTAALGSYCGVNGTYLGTGTTSGWIKAESGVFVNVASMPTSVSDTSSSELVDINGDGLDDWMHSSGGQTKFYLNTGTGWTYDELWTIATSTRHSNGWDRGIRFFDINGDGLPDYVRSYYMPAYTNEIASAIEVGSFEHVYLNTGSGFATSTLDVPVNIFSGVVESSNWSGNIDYDEAVDWNGDGIPDFSSKTSTSTATAKPDLLTSVTYPTGGTTEIEYKYSSQLGTNSDLPFPVLVVTKVTKRDGMENAELTTYGYDGGTMYLSGDVRDRRFAGFRTITKSDALGTTKTYFNQGDSADTESGEQTDSFGQIGQAYREDVISLASTTLRQTFTKWNTFDQGNGRSFVYRESELVEQWDGDADHRDVATEYVYATTTGNLTEKIERGEVTGSSDGTYVDTGSDSRFTVFSYGTTTPINLSLPTSRAVANHASTTLQHIRFYYDDQPFGSTTRGNLTTEENWISGTSYASTTRAYNTYGLVATTTDARGKTTAFTFDPHNLYIGTSTNALSHTTGFVYDYATGKVRQTTDANGHTRKFVFDPVGRLKEKIVPDSNGSLVTQSLFTYTDSEFPRKVQETRYLNSATSTDIYTYSDGWGRVVQERIESDGTYSAKDKIYGSSSVLEAESLPYFSSGSAWTSPAGGSLLTSYAYDALKRVTGIANVLGTETHAFDQWTERITDREENPKDLASDAYGNLASVVEYPEAGATTTTYTYDALSNLTKITDALGNVRNFAYDGLSRATSSEDLHAPGDATFGVTTYTYDDGGNVTSRSDPNSQTVNWTYDDLNRVLTEDYTGEAGTEVTYTYDVCTNGVGYLCTASSTGAKVENSYDPLGRVTSATTTVSGVSYVTTQTLDRQGNVTDIVYPSGSLVRYGYDAAGMMDTVSRKPFGGAWSDLLTNLDYSPTGAVTEKNFASGATTTLTYDENALYRLTRLATFGRMSTSTIASSTSEIPTPSHYWKFDESSGVAYDAIGDNDLTNNNSTPYTSGKLNNAADFERSNSNYFSITDGAQTGLDGLTDLSIAMWVNIESQPGTNDCHRFVEKNEPTDRSYVFEYCDVSGEKRLYFVASSDGSAMTTKYVTWSPALDTWYFVAATMDGGGDLKFYVDGVQQGSTQTGMPSGIYNGGSAFYVGRYDGGAYYMDGKIDEVGFWPEVLSSSAISELYNGGSGKSYPFSSPGTTATSTVMLQDINYTYDNVGNITQIFDTSSTTAEKLVVF